MIIMTIRDLLNIIPVLKELLEKPFKGAIAFKLARLVRELDKESSLFEFSRQKIAEKYGLRDENNNLIVDEEGNIKLQQDKINLCNEEMMNLLNTEITISADKIPMSAFEDIEITPTQAIIISFLIED